MAVPRVERGPAAILAADVVGYGRLMRADEEGTLAALQAHRRDLVDPLLADHRGRIVKVMGDGVLVEFSSVSDAVRCAVAIQRGMAERAADTPADQRITFRIGINIGDVIVDDQDIHGDGVNVASRLEELSRPGAVAVSAAVRDQVGDHFEYNFVDLGVRMVKQGDRPLRIYFFDHPPGGAELSTIAARPSARPSIAVLPFENLSRDPDQDYFGEGIAEDLIADCPRSRARRLQGARQASRRARRPAMLDIAERAAALEPTLASAHAARGVALLATGDPLEAKRSFERALAVGPDDAQAHYVYGRACAEWGLREEAARPFRRAADLDPYDVGYLNTLLTIYLGLGWTAEAEATAREFLARCERELALHPEFTAAALAGASALSVLGEHERALEWTNSALAIEPDDHTTLYNVACVYSVLGHVDEAVDLLERTMPGTSAHRQAWMQQDADLDPLREHP